MYIGYISDRKQLGFDVKNDILAAKKLLNLERSLTKNITLPVIYTFKKSKRIFLIIPSREILIGVIILTKCIYGDINSDINYLPSSSPKIYEHFIVEPDYLESDYLESEINLNLVLELTGGDNLNNDQNNNLNNDQNDNLNNNQNNNLNDDQNDNLNDEQMKRLKDELITNARWTNFKKFLKKILKLINHPLILNEKLWSIITQSRRPITSQLPNPSKINVLNRQNKIDSKHSNGLVNALINPYSRKQTPLEQQKLIMRQSSDELRSDGLSKNHKKLSEDIRLVEKLTRRRRTKPLYPSKILGDAYQYGLKQLERKAPNHLRDFGISVQGMSLEEMAIKYKDLVEMILSKPGLIVHKNGTINKQETTINIGDNETFAVVIFEKNPLYDKYYFISCYRISEEAFKKFEITGNIGLSPFEKIQYINKLQKSQAQEKRKKSIAHLFYTNLPEDARINNKQLREAENLNQKLKENPNYTLTEKQKKLIQRAKKYNQYKAEFYKKNPNIAKDEL